MNQRHQKLLEDLQALAEPSIKILPPAHGEITIEVSLDNVLPVMEQLRDTEEFGFDTLIDVCGVDYLGYGVAEWQTESASGTGFSRGVERGPVIADYTSDFDERRFAVVAHLLSVSNNTRLRVRYFTGTQNPPRVPSLVDTWAGANWFEREAFDMFGIIFDGHPDLRRLLTDYGFIGHPFRKDFPLSGNVEVRYDPELGRVAYQPVSIEERTLVPRVIRDDNRYDEAIRDGVDNG